MTEKELELLGFDKIDVTAKESGDKAFYYYTLDLTEYLHFITPANDEVKKGDWSISYYEDFDNTFKFTDAAEFDQLLHIHENNQKSDDD